MLREFLTFIKVFRFKKIAPSLTFENGVFIDLPIEI